VNQSRQYDLAKMGAVGWIHQPIFPLSKVKQLFKKGIFTEQEDELLKIWNYAPKGLTTYSKISASPTTKSKEHTWEHTYSLPITKDTRYAYK